MQYVDDLEVSKDEIKEMAKSLYQSLMDCSTDDGRRLIFPFLENPMKSFQPNYYAVSLFRFQVLGVCLSFRCLFRF